MDEDGAAQMFRELEGEQLSAVTFVSDYLQLTFGGPCINVTNPLTVREQASTVTSWQPGFRDALCARIGKVVSSATFEAGEALAFHFTDNSVLSISLRPSDYTSAEGIYAHGFKHKGWLAA
jgi:Flagellar basal-body P-ring protein